MKRSSPVKKRIPETRKFLLKWESREPNRLLNMSQEEKEQLTDKLSFHQIADLAPKAFHDDNARRKRKWKEIRQLWTVLSMKEYSFQTIENAFWKQTYGTLSFFISIPNRNYLTPTFFLPSTQACSTSHASCLSLP